MITDVIRIHQRPTLIGSSWPKDIHWMFLSVPSRPPCMRQQTNFPPKPIIFACSWERERERERRLCEVWFLLHVSKIVWAFTFASDPLGRLSKESFEASFIASDTLDSYFSWITETDYCNSFGSAIAEDFCFWELYSRTTQVWLSPPNLPHCVSAAQWPWSFFNLWRRSKTKHDPHIVIVCITV